MIIIKGKEILDDYIKAQKFHARKRDFIFIISTIVIAILVAVGSGEYIFPGILLIYLIIRPSYMRTRYKRTWENTPSFHKSLEANGFDENGFYTEDDGGNLSVIHWDKFIKWRESKEIFLIYLSPHLFVFLPKRLVSPEEQNQIRELLKQKIGQ
jgi:hypothetical protein